MKYSLYYLVNQQGTVNTKLLMKIEFKILAPFYPNEETLS